MSGGSGKTEFMSHVYQAMYKPMINFCFRYLQNREDAEDVFHSSIMKKRFLTDKARKMV
ncbi:MAG: hypothetical protein QMD97_01680 [Candidatus Aenigmarchaeota archaeon]|nr:hypothetical protein [Candidatus Aenigmarchaeota archaeon]